MLGRVPARSHRQYVFFFSPKSGPVETGPTGPVALALVLVIFYIAIITPSDRNNIDVIMEG